MNDYYDINLKKDRLKMYFWESVFSNYSGDYLKSLSASRKHLSEVEKTILISITEVCEVSGEFNSQDLRQHDLVKNIPSASYHRSLKSLQNSGFIKKQADRSRSKYFMTSGFSASEK